MVDVTNLRSMKSIAITKGYKYKVHEQYIVKLRYNPGIAYKCKQFELTKNGWLIIEDTYCYDGASGPTIDTANTYRGSAVHDVLYQLMRLEVIPYSFREKADYEMYYILREDGMWYTRAKPWLIGLRVGAGKHAKPSAKKKVYRYPN